MTKQEYQDKIKANWNNPYIDKYQILMRNTEVSVDYASSLEIENEKLKGIITVAAKWLSEYTGSCPNDLFDWQHPETCDKHCNNGMADCWQEWLMQCPEPPEE